MRTFLAQEVWYGEVPGEEKVGGMVRYQFTVFGGLVLQPRPSLMEEENCWQCRSWSSDSTGYTALSGLVMVGKVAIAFPFAGGLGLVWLLHQIRAASASSALAQVCALTGKSRVQVGALISHFWTLVTLLLGECLT